MVTAALEGLLDDVADALLVGRGVGLEFGADGVVVDEVAAVRVVAVDFIALDHFVEKAGGADLADFCGGRHLEPQRRGDPRASSKI